MPLDHHRQLTNFFINRSLQLRLIIISLGYMAMMLAVTLIFAFLPVLGPMYDTGDPNLQYQAARTFLLLAQRLVPAALLLFALFFIHLALMTHRICGPLVNFTHTFERMAEGDFTRRVRLRRKDYLHDEAEAINEVQDNLREHLTALREENHALMETLAKAEATPTPEALAEVRKQSEKVDELVSAFHL